MTTLNSKHRHDCSDLCDIVNTSLKSDLAWLREIEEELDYDLEQREERDERTIRRGKSAVNLMKTNWENVLVAVSQLKEDFRKNTTKRDFTKKTKILKEFFKGACEALDLSYEKALQVCRTCDEAYQRLTLLKEKLEETRDRIQKLCNGMENFLNNVFVRPTIQIKQEPEDADFIVAIPDVIEMRTPKQEPIHQSVASQSRALQDIAPATESGTAAMQQGQVQPEQQLPQADEQQPDDNFQPRDQQNAIPVPQIVGIRNEDRGMTTSKKFFEICKNERGSEDFIFIYSHGEEAYLSAQHYSISLENGSAFAPMETSFNTPVLIKSRDGLQMRLPIGLNFETIYQYMEKSDETDNWIFYTNSLKQCEEKPLPLKSFVDLLRTPKELRRPKSVINVLSSEHSASGSFFDTRFEIPEFVRKQSMEGQLFEKLREEIVDLEAKVGNPENEQAEKTKYLRTIKKLTDLINKMPKYTKYMIISEKGSFTDVHVDFSGSSVFYTVWIGQKIIYLAPPTKKNLEIYERYERMDKKDEKRRKWIGETMKNEWERIVLEEGETVIIPSGYIHFVFTPVDSIVFGGNFLMPHQLETQFGITELEDDLLANRKVGIKNLYKEFYSVMYCYIDKILIDQLQQNQDNPSAEAQVFKTQAAVFARKLKLISSKGRISRARKEHLTCEMYSEKEQKRILDSLKRFVPEVASGTSSAQPSHVGRLRNDDRDPVVTKRRK